MRTDWKRLLHSQYSFPKELINIKVMNRSNSLSDDQIIPIHTSSCLKYCFTFAAYEWYLSIVMSCKE